MTLLSSCAFNYETLAMYLLKYYGGALTSGDGGRIAAFLENAKRISVATGYTNELGRGWNIARDMPEDELLDFFSGWIATQEIISCISGKAQAILTQPLGSVANTGEVAAGADRRGSFLGIVSDLQKIGTGQHGSVLYHAHRKPVLCRSCRAPASGKQTLTAALFSPFRGGMCSVGMLGQSHAAACRCKTFESVRNI